VRDPERRPSREGLDHLLAEGPVTRRDLVSWMGRAAAFSLFAPWLEACVRPEGPFSPIDLGPGRDLPGGPDGAAGDAGFDTPPDRDLATGDATAEAAEEADAADAGDAADSGDAADATDAPSPAQCDPDLVPGTTDAPIFQSWKGNTVDPQDEASLLSSWRLVIGGLVEREVVMDFCALRDMGLDDQVTDFHCVEGWSVYDVPWNGIRLGRLLALAGVRPEARYLKITSVGGHYTESLPLSVAYEPRTLLGIGIGGDALPMKHGFPARIVVPRLLGYKNAKCVARIDLAVTEHVGFWERYGYPVSGEVPEARLREGKY
jgi:DMSO/TMAO reductase YedYZ molybdopterin-dependent catalytic subunit